MIDPQAQKDTAQLIMLGWMLASILPMGILALILTRRRKRKDQAELTDKIQQAIANINATRESK